MRLPSHAVTATLRHRACVILTAAASLSVTVPCGDAFDERLQWLLSLSDAASPLLRVEEIGPADGPRYARVSGSGVSLWLNRDKPALPLSLRVATPLVAPEEPPPPGCEAISVGLDPSEGHPRAEPLPLRLPACKPSFVVSGQSDGGWGVGRAGMLYRDLLPDRAGGAAIVSHIRIPNGGEVPDYVHFHRIHFQMILCLRGWVEVVYEGQGEPFRLEPGDFVTQPPTIRHRVLRCSDGLEVLEVGLPAEHATLADHEHPLPSGDGDGDATVAASGADALFGGQRFVRHQASVAAAAADEATAEHGVAWHETAVGDATDGLVRVRFGTCVDAAAAAAPLAAHDDALALGFVLDGTATLEVEQAEEGAEESRVQPHVLATDDFFCVPPGQRCRLVGASEGLRLLEVRLAAYYAASAPPEEAKVSQAAEEEVEELPFYESYDAVLGELDVW